MKQTKRYLAALVLCAILTTACGGGFASNLRSVLLLSGPLIDSLVASGVIKPELKETFIRDFRDLEDGAASLKENLDGCHRDKACKLGAVDVFQQVFFDVQRRGHLGSVEKLRRIESIVSGIILAARIYYGGAVTTADARVTPGNAEQVLKTRLKELETEMKVK